MRKKKVCEPEDGIENKKQINVLQREKNERKISKVLS